MRLFWTLTTLGCVALVGCGGDDEEENPPPQSDPATVNAPVAEATVQGLASAIELAQTGDGLSAAFAMSALGTSAMTMVVPTGGAAPQSIDATGSSQQALTTGTCDCTDNSCTFDGCGDDGSAFTISGTLSWTDTTLVCDLTLTGSTAGTEYNFGQDCDLTFSDTSLDGHFGSTGSLTVAAQGQTVASDWDTSIDFNSVTLASGCATSGSVDVSATVTANGATYSGSGSVELTGNGC